MRSSVQRRDGRSAASPTFAAAVLVFIGASTGCGGEARGGLRIYDPSTPDAPGVTSAEIVRSSVHAQRGLQGSGVLRFRFTRRGARNFRLLTLAVARKGSEKGRPQRIAFEVDDRIYARPFVDYRIYPRGLDGSPGIEITLGSFAMAQRLAKRIRD